MKKYRMFKIKYIGATNFKGSRISITDSLLQQRKFIPYNYKYNNSLDIAIDYLKNKSINITGFAEFEDYYYIFTDNFDIEIL